MISIVIPAYNNLKLFRIALNSVLRQKNVEIEIIVIDDSLNFEIENYCKPLVDSRIRYFHNKPSKGAINNWNYGISLAKGENVILLHHDEAFKNEYYLSKVEKKLKDKDIVIHNKIVYIGEKEKKDKIPEWIKKFAIKLKYPLLALNFIGPCACVSLKRDLFVPFDTRLHWKVDTDWYFQILSKTNKFEYYSEREIISHHGHEGQITNNIDIENVNRADIYIIKEKYKSYIVDFFIQLGLFFSKMKRFVGKIYPIF